MFLLCSSMFAARGAILGFGQVPGAWSCPHCWNLPTCEDLGLGWLVVIPHEPNPRGYQSCFNYFLGADGWVWGPVHQRDWTYWCGYREFREVTVLGCMWEVCGLEISCSDAEGAPGNCLSILKRRNGTFHINWSWRRVYEIFHGLGFNQIWSMQL